MAGPTTVVLQAHPLEDSYNAALLKVVTGSLDQIGVRPMVHRFSTRGKPPAGSLDNCRHMVVVAPTWWGTMPAVVLDWLQDLLGPWIDGAEPPSRSPIRSVERLSVVTTHGSPRWTNLLQGEPGRQYWKRTVVPLCRSGASFEWIALYKIDRADIAARQAFLADVDDRIAAGALATTG